MVKSITASREDVLRELRVPSTFKEVHDRLKVANKKISLRTFMTHVSDMTADGMVCSIKPPANPPSDYPRKDNKEWSYVDSSYLSIPSAEPVYVDLSEHRRQLMDCRTRVLLDMPSILYDLPEEDSKWPRTWVPGQTPEELPFESNFVFTRCIPHHGGSGKKIVKDWASMKKGYLVFAEHKFALAEEIQRTAVEVVMRMLPDLSNSDRCVQVMMRYAYHAEISKIMQEGNQGSSDGDADEETVRHLAWVVFQESKRADITEGRYELILEDIAMPAWKKEFSTNGYNTLGPAMRAFLGSAYTESTQRLAKRIVDEQADLREMRDAFIEELRVMAEGSGVKGRCALMMGGDER